MASAAFGRASSSADVGLFGEEPFPALHSLVLTFKDVNGFASNWLERFPNLVTASVGLGRAKANDAHLALNHFDEASLAPLVRHLETPNFDQLATLVVEEIRVSVASQFNSAETKAVLLQFGYDPPDSDEFAASFEVDDDYDNREEEEKDAASEDLEFDSDAEDGDEFRSRWSVEKREVMGNFDDRTGRVGAMAVED
ncbi:hypothetical protein JCM10212_000795 [Sporobolomyces blumeae]